MQTAVSPGEFRRYAAPGVLGMIGISCYILADTFFVAKGTGSLGLAALNIAIPAYNLMNGLGLMVGVGGATHYSLCRAQGDAVEADRTFTHTLLLGLCIALLFVLTGTFGVVPLSRLLGANAETLDMTAVYLRLLLCFAPFFVTNNVMIAFVRNDGEPGRAMAGMIAGSLFNIVFDWVLNRLPAIMPACSARRSRPAHRRSSACSCSPATCAGRRAAFICAVNA